MSNHMNGARRTWWLFGAGTLTVVVMMVLISFVVLQLERETLQARTEADHQEAIRLSLWRMDSWLASRLVSEASRPYFEYRPFYTQRNAYTGVLNRLEPDSIYTPSPLLTYVDEVLALHFQVEADGTVNSPQVPTGNYRDLSEAALLDEDVLAFNEDKLERVTACLDAPFPELCSLATTPQTASPRAQTIDAAPQQTDQVRDPAAQQMRSQQEWISRQETNDLAQKAAAYSNNMLGRKGGGEPQADDSAEPAIHVGPLVPAWTTSTETGERELVYMRHVNDGEATRLQGFLVEWPRLQAILLEQVADLFAVASLVPFEPNALDAMQAHRGLATLPAALDVAPPVIPSLRPVTPARLAVGLTWLVVVLAIFATGLGLRANLAYAERRHRFASAVTHELRTPLTTFQMYSEMLAEGMVCDPAQRQAYLDTMHLESGRLAALVENVLGYARLEKGGGATRCAPMTTAAVLEHVLPRLERCAAAGGVSLEVDRGAADAIEVVADAEAVGQILLNLIDNACKYAGGSRPRRVALGLDRTDTHVVVSVSDNGPGVPAGCEKRIFTAFDRAGRRTADATGGIGLGLALSRGLALDQGGDLRLGRNGDDGATFELLLRRA